ncbi:enoyl-CoA hydratase domain-containing protein 3, mitochondrial isoform X2 [Sipha flava]|nr:enoyl-CoA hydratase domain-containing protein 3, mitochondrial isoform X2 [Sipha flava]XP_025408527.1 enoyl-CoA hydratase domain-containing protein 3, mitochondrial isoform X2 [Sipha flava]
MSVIYYTYRFKMLKPVVQLLCRHKSSSASASIITTFKTDNSYRITLSDPKTRNTLSIALLQNLIQEIQNAGNDSSIKSIVLCGSGPVFSAGHNLNELRIPENQKNIFSLATKLMNIMIDCPIPIIACVDGIAAASGCQLVAASDIAICTNRSFFSTPGINLGLFCSTPGIPLSRVVSQKTASYMLFTGAPINAEEALRTGLVSKIVRPEEFDDEISKLTTLIGQKSRTVITLGKTFFYKQIDENVKLAYKKGEQVMLENLELDDCKEGLQSFVEKRKPNW